MPKEPVYVPGMQERSRKHKDYSKIREQALLDALNDEDREKERERLKNL
jgi:hypothetical protein